MRRVVTGFTSAQRAAQPLDTRTPLVVGQPAYFCLELGHAVQSIVPAIREGTSPPAKLTVALFTFAGELVPEAGVGLGEIEIQPDGTARVVRQPGTLPELPAGSDLLSQRLFFLLVAPSRTGVLGLRCNIYYAQVLVHSRVVRIQVVQQEERAGAAIPPVEDYVIARTLDPAHLRGIAPHRLSVMLNSNGDGTHSLRFYGEAGFKSDATFTEGELTNLIATVRGALRKVAWGDNQDWIKGKPYRYLGTADRERLRRDLVELAITGFRFYFTIKNRLAGSRDNADILAALMHAPGYVQIAMKDTASLVLPAAMIYDYEEFDTNADRTSYTLCPDFLTALDGADPLEQCACCQGKCPSRGKQTVVCPSGFWGYRHRVGMPLSLGSAPEAPTDITFAGAPLLTVCVSTDPQFTLRAKHLEALRNLRADIEWKWAESRADTLRLMKEAKAQLIYFYCHGGVQDMIPYIQVGPRKERGITPDNLNGIRWDAPRPLVFINGCHTTAVEPKQALQFVNAFVEEAGASGVIGTDITVFEPLASTFAENCLRRVLGGASIGEAILGARLALLKGGNPLGLVYLPFVIPSLHVKDVATEPDRAIGAAVRFANVTSHTGSERTST